MDNKLTKIYRINLRGIDTKSFDRNPIVLQGFDYNELPIGKANILKGKTSVKVEYYDFVPDYPHSIGIAVAHYDDGKRPTLISLSPVPLATFGGISPFKGNMIGAK